MKTGPSRNVSSPRLLSITIEPVMSPGIRSGVNCTRLVRTDSAAARLRTSNVFATPGTPSISTWPPQSSATSRPDTAASWPTTAFATSVRTAPRRARASLAWHRWGWSSGVMRWDTSLSSSVELVGQVGQVAVVGGWDGIGSEQGVDLVDAAPGVLRRRRRRARRGRRGEGRPSRSASRARAAARSASAAWRAVAGPAVETPEVARRLDRLDLDRQRLHGQRTEPARAPHDSATPVTSSSQRAGTSQRGSRLDAETLSPPTRSASDGTYQTRCGALAEQPQRDGGVVALEDLVVGEGRGGPEQGQARPRLGEQHPARAAEAAVGVERLGLVHPQRQPVVRRAAGGDRSVRRRSSTAYDADAELRGRAPGRAPTTTSRAVPLVREQPPRSWSGPGWSDEVTTTSGRGVGRGPVERVGRPDHVDRDALLVEHPGQRLGARRRRGSRVERRRRRSGRRGPATR